MTLALLQPATPAVLDPLTNATMAFWRGLLERAPYLISAILMVLLGFVVASSAGRAIRRVRREGTHANLGEILSRLVKAGIIVLSFLVGAVILFPTFKPGDLIAGLGITSVAIGFAFKDILQKFFAGLLLLWRQPFKVGDEIRSGDFEGVVEDINTRSTRIHTYDGMRAVLPNGDVYTRPILVRTAYAQRRVTFTFGISYQSSVERAKELVLSVLKKTDGVLSSPPCSVYVTEFADSSVNLNAYFWVAPQQANMLRVRDRVVSGIKMALDEAGIEIPYPQRVIEIKGAPGLFGEQEASRVAVSIHSDGNS